MCGRTACTLAPDDICNACGHKGKNGKQTKPRWRDPPGGQYKYYQSYNVAPTSHTPVLVSKQLVSNTEEEEELETENESDWVVQPMHWGLVPHWHTGDPKKVGYNMSNARSDSMLEKRTFKGPLEKGQRCVVLVDGYFEWHTAKDGSKQPYYIHFPTEQQESPSEVKLEKCEQETELKTESDETKSEEKDQNKPRLLTMAGLFDIWKPKDGGPPLYSYSIITVDAHKDLSFIHHRMPAILNGEQEVRDWLDFGDVPLTKAIKLIRPTGCVTQHPVTKDVGNVRNKSEENIKKIDLLNPKKSASSKMMMAWLSKGNKTPNKSEAADNSTVKNEAPPGKKIKTE